MNKRRWKRIIKGIFDSLKGKAVLNDNPGKLILSNSSLSRKDRRNSGRVYPKIWGPQKILDEDGVPVDWYWDDWVDYRDGFRDRIYAFGYTFKECKQFDKEMKKKIKEKYEIRKLRQGKIII
jgi:hypothetical protein